ncbi:glycosyltransferase family 2 protein [Enterobacter sp. Ap-1006]|uniref:glycosyltransferase family 2 protein n=1 Tax=Enterobacter sp. Ap-1006 TaxID=2608345 RepID=UPI001423BA17|nr:glycosyltransferase family 2 protein [Enterobacter sp. Ap-1006]NIF46736.1 glycosyltransferase family 2 protein [Enterobacter sp. Ap-1006]
MATAMINNDNSQEFKVTAVIVTYNPVISNLSSLVSALQRQVSNTIIVDNGSNNANEIAIIKEELPGIHLLLLPNNVGIAAAQNIGIRQGLSNSDDFTLFFDQDSTVTDDFVLKMVKDFLTIKQKNNIGALGPTLQDSRYKKIYPVIHLSKHGLRTKIIPDPQTTQPLEVSCIIASGCLIDNAVLIEGNLMDESLFIDYVDTEWCLRIIERGYKIFVTPNVIMQHEIGDMHISLFRFVIPVHSPWRRYFRVRNGFYLLLMPHVPKLISCREIVFSFIHQVILFVAKRDVGYLKYYLKSVRDGLKNIYATYHNRKS